MPNAILVVNMKLCWCSNSNGCLHLGGVQVNWNLNISHPRDERRLDGTTYQHVLEWVKRHHKAM